MAVAQANLLVEQLRALDHVLQVERGSPIPMNTVADTLLGQALKLEVLADDLARRVGVAVEAAEAGCPEFAPHGASTWLEIGGSPDSRREEDAFVHLLVAVVDQELVHIVGAGAVGGGKEGWTAYFSASSSRSAWGRSRISEKSATARW